MHKRYTQATLELLRAGIAPAEVLKGLKQSLVNHHHEQLYRTVLRNVVKVLECAPATTSVIVAKHEDYTDAKAAIHAELEQLGAHKDDEPVVVIDDTIIGGHIVEHAHQRINHSYKHALVSLYQRITHQ